MKEQSCPFRYLGVMVGLKRLPMSAFDPLLHRVRSKLSTWKARLLSFAGRVTLIKSVLQSLLVYLMSSSWVPKTILKKIEGLFRFFLWSNDGENRRMALVSWENLCKPKAAGGLGLHELLPFQRALMGKLLARIIANPSSMTGQISRRKYMSGPTVWSMKPSRRSSSLWRAISLGAEVLQQDTIWEIGDGSSIDVSHEPWLGTTPLQWLPTCAAVQEMQNMKVADFIDENKQWDKGRLELFFSLDLIPSILKIPIAQSAIEDAQTFAGKAVGRYRVRDGYNVITRCRENRTVDMSWIWRLPASERLKSWIWKAVLGVVPTKLLLFQRKLSNTIRCARCGRYGEDLFHLLTDCIWSRDIWRQLQGEVGEDLSAIYPSALWCKMEKWVKEGKSSTNRCCYAVYGLWIIWKQRNDATFNAEPCDTEKAVHAVKFQAEERICVYGLKGRLPVSFRWEAPEEDEIKLNFDGAFNRVLGTAGWGYVVRDHNYRILLAGGSWGSTRSVEEAEFKALREGVVEVMKRWPNRKLWVEGDSATVID